MKTVLLAGGYGTRFAEMTEAVPKPMVPIGGKPILWHIMKHYTTFGHRDFIICLGYKADVIRNYMMGLLHNMSDFTVDLGTGEIQYHNRAGENWRLTLIDTGIDTGTGGRLRKIQHLVEGETFCMTYGDGVSNVDIAALKAHHAAQGKLATVTAIVPPSRYGCLDMDGDDVVSFSEKPDAARSFARINGGFFVLDAGVIDYIHADSDMWEDQPMQDLVAAKQMSAFKHDGYWQCMDNLRDHKNLEALWVTGKAPWKTW
ncbi:glucose-1-phosphate cytidylyltransferase [Kordiimonas pumila]|uniref:Glucose-1-phosphate cytidylyltransferase n=1 Tax=Kordiimonas pumila TaxID=2161677 RepID=A0ABV7D067_9PROT|nr:glucose-1-phosphate cytidylyltransferase [Kordiimonas pumila]